MATSTAARSIFRSCAASRSAARFAATESKAATAPRSSFRIPGPKQSSPARRCPVELSFCLESMLPYHSATATSLMTSLLFTRPYSWLSEAPFPYILTWNAKFKAETSELAVMICDECPMSSVQVLFKVHAHEEKQTWKP